MNKNLFNEKTKKIKIGLFDLIKFVSSKSFLIHCLF